MWEPRNPSTAAFDNHTSEKKQAIRMQLTITVIILAKCNNLHLYSYYVFPR